MSNKMQLYTVYFIWKLLHMFRVVMQTTVSTASVICHTVIATCHYHGRVGTGLSVHSTLRPVPGAVDSVVCAPNDGWGYHPKHVVSR
jgi:hypothetical protein